MKLNLDKLAKAARRELAIRQEAERRKRRAMFSLIAVADGHVAQLRMMEDMRRHVLALCSRRAGKTTGMAGLMLATAVQGKANILYIGLTRGQAKKTMWMEIWKPMCERWGIDCTHNETELTTYFPNGSFVGFSGTDDIRHIETYLGNKLHLVIVDEAQSQSTAILEQLVNRILPPALSDDGGRLILAGTIPETPAGYFYKEWEAGRWSNHTWSRFDNPHLKNQEQRLQEHLEVSGLTIDDPLIQRDWFGRMVFSASALAFRYDSARNGFGGDILVEHPDPLSTIRLAPQYIIESCDTFAVGIDPGTRDRTALIVWGWSRTHDRVYQVYEWVTRRNADTAWRDIGTQLNTVQARFRPTGYRYDAGGSRMTLDLMVRDFGVLVLHAAKKGDRFGTVQRMNDLLLRGLMQVMIGGELEGDFLKTKWDKDAREKGKWEWSSHNHPDVADAGRYGIEPYWDTYKPPEPKRPQQTPYEEAMARMKEQAKKQGRIGYHAQQLRRGGTGGSSWS